MQITCEPVEGTSLGNDSCGGVVLCSRFLTMTAKKTSSRSKSYLSLAIMGTHAGSVTFWRHNSPSGDLALNAAPGVRRSVPRAMQELLHLPRLPASFVPAAELDTKTTTNATRSTTTGSTATGLTPPPPQRAVCTMEVISFGVGSNVAILCLGLECGRLELWILSATEHNEDEEREGGSSHNNSHTNLHALTGTKAYRS